MTTHTDEQLAELVAERQSRALCGVAKEGVEIET